MAPEADQCARWMGERGYLEDLAGEWAPEVAEDEGFCDWFVWHMRRSLSPGAALTAFRAAMELDIRDVLSAVRVPTLVIAHPARPGPAHYIAQRIRGAEIAELPPLQGLYTWVDDDAHRATMEATGRFVSRLARPTGSERVLATILFTDIVGSTELSARIGDAAWRDSSSVITRSSVANSGGSRVGNSTRRATDSSPPSTGRRVQSRLPLPSATRCDPRDPDQIRPPHRRVRSERGQDRRDRRLDRARISSLAVPARYSFRARSRSSSPAQVPRSRIGATTY